MAVVETKIDSSASLTVHTILGEITIQEIKTIIDKYYNDTITKLILWDFTCASANMQFISSDDIRSLADLTKKYCSARTKGKTALVFNQTLAFGMGRMFELYSEVKDENVEFRSFKEMSSALEWLGVSNYE